ncbi:MAG: Gfo/Idh/MocA family oxidoreductase, partial [Spirochaetales bacterium]
MRIPCAIIGLGRIGSLLEQDPLREKPATHAGAIVDNPQCHLLGGYDTNPQRCAEFSSTWGVPADFPSAEAMLRALKPKIVHIATHPDSHAYYTELAAKEGVSVVVCEKPLTDTWQNALRILRLHQKKVIKVITNHERRYSADYVYAKQQIEQHTFGQLLSIYARLYFGYSTPLYKQLYHDGTHLIDCISFLTGNPLQTPQVKGNLYRKKGTA